MTWRLTLRVSFLLIGEWRLSLGVSFLSIVINKQLRGSLRLQFISFVGNFYQQRIIIQISFSTLRHKQVSGRDRSKSLLLHRMPNQTNKLAMLDTKQGFPKKVTLLLQSRSVWLPQLNRPVNFSEFHQSLMSVGGTGPMNSLIH
jgi:hypothetical protein